MKHTLALAILALFVGAIAPQATADFYTEHTVDLAYPAREFSFTLDEGIGGNHRFYIEDNGTPYAMDTNHTAYWNIFVTWQDAPVIAIASSATGTNYVDFAPTAAQTGTNIASALATLILYDETPAAWHSWRGAGTIRENPGAGAPSTNLFTAIVTIANYTWLGMFPTSAIPDLTGLYASAADLTTIEAGLTTVSGRVDTVEGYTNEAHTAYGWGDHSAAGYLPTTGGTMSGNLDMGGNTASNGTFSGTHTGDGSGLTGLPSGGSDGYWTNDVDNAHPGGTAVLTGTSPTNLHWTPVASSAFVGFHSYRTNDSWTATRIVYTTVIHPQESYDPYNLHNTTTGAFRPNTSGVWQIGAFLMPDDTSWTASGGNAYFKLFSNTTAVATLEVYRWTTAYGPRSTAPAVYEDYFDSGTDYYLKFYHDDGANRPMQGAKSDCYFWASLKGVLP